MIDVDDAFTCWCGDRGTPEELLDEDGLDQSCGGGGVLYCWCGGDFCVCHHHGEIECPGCDECEHDEDAEYQEWEL